MQWPIQFLTLGRAIVDVVAGAALGPEPIEIAPAARLYSWRCHESCKLRYVLHMHVKHISIIGTDVHTIEPNIG